MQAEIAQLGDIIAAQEATAAAEQELHARVSPCLASAVELPNPAGALLCCLPASVGPQSSTVAATLTVGPAHGGLPGQSFVGTSAPSSNHACRVLQYAAGSLALQASAVSRAVRFQGVVVGVAGP